MTQSPAAQEQAIRDWTALRAKGDIQFTPLRPMEPPKPPAWLERVQEWLESALGPAGQWLAQSWPTLKWVLLAIGALLVLLLAWRLIAPLTGWRPRSGVAAEWAPGREQALALLEDADSLAAAGRFGEATHLLLIRSVGQIHAVRPDWLDPSSTAREIATLTSLPERARNAFGVIAARVERNLFALIPLAEDDWLTARAAYADFALSDLRAGGA